MVRNNWEYQVYKEIKNLLPRRATVEYEADNIPYTITGNYLVDFTITKKDGSKIYIEAKGGGRAFDAKVQQKMKAVREQHPDLDLRILFYRDNKIGAKRKDDTFRRQSDWARDNGFKFAVGLLPPKEWFEE